MLQYNANRSYTTTTTGHVLQQMGSLKVPSRAFHSRNTMAGTPCSCTTSIDSHILIFGSAAGVDETEARGDDLEAGDQDVRW
jgi:hypothetical protein